MKAPDKIYLSKLLMAGAEILDTPVSDSDVEYIRKDVLLKWIQEARAIPHENAITRDLTFQEVINKLNSM